MDPLQSTDRLLLPQQVWWRRKRRRRRPDCHGGSKFPIHGITQICRGTQTRGDRLQRLQLQLSHRAQRRETPLIPVCNPCLILPEKSSKSTGFPANTARRGAEFLGCFWVERMTSVWPQQRASTGDGSLDCKPLHPTPSWELGYGRRRWNPCGCGKRGLQFLGGTHRAVGSCAVPTLIRSSGLGSWRAKRTPGCPFQANVWAQ